LRRAILVLSVVGSGCFYTQPLAGPPRASIARLDPSDPHPGGVVPLAARVEDGRGELSCRWEVARCDEAGCEPTSGAVTLPCDEPYLVSIDGEGAVERHAPRLVTLTVTDERQASAVAREQIRVVSRPPTVELQARQADQVAARAVVGAPVEITAEVDDPDGDGWQIVWRVEGPGARSLEALADDRQRLVPDVIGVWDVSATARDAYGAEATTTLPIVVGGDAAPCLARTDPEAGAGVYPLVRSEGPRAFRALLVDDDLDSHPVSSRPGPGASAARFRWSLRAPILGDARIRLGEVGPGVIVDPARFPVGSVLDLRLEVADRVDRPGCDAAAPRCEARPTCAQRVTWEIEIR
jgi:hypothetical protein